MIANHKQTSPPLINLNSLSSILIAAIATTVLCYLAAELAGTLVLRPEMLWPVWPGCALLVALLLLTPTKTWPVLITAGFAGFMLNDLLAFGLSIRYSAILILGDTIEVLIAALGIRYLFGNVVLLNGKASMARYFLVAVILAPISAAFISAIAFLGSYRTFWGIGVLTEGLALLTVTPAVLGLVRAVTTKQHEWRVYIEGTAIMMVLFVLGYVTFISADEGHPELLYSLVPILLWSALRLGITGTSVSIIVIAFLSIWGAVHGHGPFVGRGTIRDVMSLQMFLLFTATPFMFLSAIVEERKLTEESLRESEGRFRLAAHAGRMFAYEWDVATDIILRSEESTQILGIGDAVQITGQEVLAKTHSDDRERVVGAVTALSPEQPYLQLCYRMVRADGAVIWVERSSRAQFDAQGRMIRVVGMVADITQRRLAEEALRQSEEKFRTVFRDAGIGMVIVSPEGQFLGANGSFCECLGYTEEELLTKNVEAVTLPDDWPVFSQRLHTALEEGRGFHRIEKRCLHKSGRIVYTESSTSLIRSHDGTPQYFVGEVLDVTRRKEAEETLSRMTRKLIEAQEQERARIGRELHDDINQRLAFLGLELEQLQENPSEMRSRVQGLRRQISEISDDMQALSHDLHSSKLEYLGVPAGIKSWCKEFSERQKLEINFKADLSTVIPLEVGVSLFRVLQEALQNAVKHSGVRHIDVELLEYSNEVHLIVTDKGVGFDLDAALRGRGLGLTSMRERVRLVSGTIGIESSPMQGTTIHVRVPMESGYSARRVAV